ncbi:helix-turn-helix transcriptional regulator [Corynebacterium sp. MSK004]|uniref:helix-turn-helix domain-containing protein n=1 Tax=Corynebacterium sp. MSK004 TaxID=3050186 RepID=UPI003306C329
MSPCVPVWGTPFNLAPLSMFVHVCPQLSTFVHVKCYHLSMSTGPRKTPDKVTIEIASLLREHAARRQMTQKHIASYTELSTSQTSRYLRGESSPNIHEYVVLCEAVGAHPDTLLAQALHNIRWREQYAHDDEHAVPVEGQVRYNLDPRNFPPADPRQ